MCGIVGYVGHRDCSDVLVSALTKLEYRGYDSAGIAVFDGDHFHTENLSMKYLERYLNDILPEMETVLSDIDTCPWKNY